MNRTRRISAVAVLAAGLAVTAACGSSSNSTTASSTPGTSVARAQVTVADPWARRSPAAVTNGAVYLTLTSNVGDKLVKASVPSTVAKTAELHETVIGATGGSTPGTMPGSTMMGSGSMPGSTMMGSGSMPGSTMMGSGSMPGSTMMGSGSMPGTTMAGSGEMSMQPVDAIDLPAGTAVQLKPGGYHIMLIDLVAPLKSGDTVEVTLTFEKAGEQKVSAPVKDS